MAAKKKKVVWKLMNNFHLLDFSGEAAKFDGPLEELDPRILDVLEDVEAWLILDGGQTGGFECECHVLVPCSDKKENYAEFCKGQLVSQLYLPVWEGEEISQFLDAFEKSRLEYPNMSVPLKEEAMENFALLGGVARYVLCSRNTSRRLEESRGALCKLDVANCLKMLRNDSDALSTTRDVLVHMTCGPNIDDRRRRYGTRAFKLATSEVKLQVMIAFEENYKADMVKILKTLVSCKAAGSERGYIFELVAHYLFIVGDKFRMKRVYDDGNAAQELEYGLTVPKLAYQRFRSLEELPKSLEADTYYYPEAENFASIDAIVSPGRLLQFFSYSRGKHGYLVTGLEKVDAQLKQDKYQLCSCVPKEKYEETGFQPWLTSKGVKYAPSLPSFLQKFEQYVIEIDYEKFG